MRKPKGAGAAGHVVDQVLAAAPFGFLMGVRVALWCVVLAPLVVLGTLRTFGRLDAGERRQVLEAFRTSRRYLVRELLVLLKSLACLAWCGLPPVQAAIGIERP
jgi:hypothetical protein